MWSWEELNKILVPLTLELSTVSSDSIEAYALRGEKNKWKLILLLLNWETLSKCSDQIQTLPLWVLRTDGNWSTRTCKGNTRNVSMNRAKNWLGLGFYLQLGVLDDSKTCYWLATCQKVNRHIKKKGLEFQGTKIHLTIFKNNKKKIIPFI